MQQPAVFFDHKYILLFVAIIANFFFQTYSLEFIPVNDGIGYDGVHYADFVVRIDEIVRNGELSNYYAQKILPSLIVRNAFRLFHIEASDANIVQAFIYLNISFMLGAALFWCRIAGLLNLNTAAFVIGSVGLFLSVPNAKMMYYLPVLTDSVAFFIGCGMVYASIRRSYVLLTVLSVVGYFAWQLSGLVGLALALSFLLVPQQERPGLSAERLMVFAKSLIQPGFIVMTVAAFAVLASIAFLSLFPSGDAYGRIMNRFRLLTNLPMLVLWLMAILYLLYAIYLEKFSVDLRPASLAVAVAACLIIIFLPISIRSLIANPELPAPGLDSISSTINAALRGRVPVGKLLLPLVSHTIWFGPVFLLLVFKWKSTVETCQKLGGPFVMALLIFVGFSIFAESRFNTLVWPFVVVAISVSVPGWNFTSRTVSSLCILSFVYSRLWLRFNMDSWPDPYPYSYVQGWSVSNFVSLLGPWMTWPFYLFQSVIVALSAIWIWKMFNPKSDAIGCPAGSTQDNSLPAIST